MVKLQLFLWTTAFYSNFQNPSENPASSLSDFLLTCRYKGNIRFSGPLPGSWLAARMADLTPDLQVYLSWGSVAKGSTLCNPSSLLAASMSSWDSQAHAFHQLVCQKLSWLHSTCLYQRSLLSFRMRSRSSMSFCTSSSLDLVVTSCSLALQIRLIIALSFRCRRGRFGFVSGQVSLPWSIVLRTQELYSQPHVLKERWREERSGSSPWTSYRWFSHLLWLKDHSLQLLRACLLGSERKLPPPACQVRLTSLCGLPSKVLAPCTSVIRVQQGRTKQKN